MDDGALRLPWVDWHELWKRDDTDHSIIPGVAFPGRWTAIAAPAKAGKSTLITGLAVELARTGIDVAYVDTEMGSRDMQGRLEDWMQLEPGDVEHFHYLDSVSYKLDTVNGAAAFLHDIDILAPAVVIIDGLNGVVDGAENEAETWRDLYDLTIAELKRRGHAVITADNLGKDTGRGPRGSSVKLDKADGVLSMEKTDDGCKLVTTHWRTADYPKEQSYVIVGADEDDPALTVRRVVGSDPEGTSELVVAITELGLPYDISVRKARAALKAAGHKTRNDALAAALRTRRNTLLPAIQGSLLPETNETAGQSTRVTVGNTDLLVTQECYPPIAEPQVDRHGEAACPDKDMPAPDTVGNTQSSTGLWEQF